MPRRIYWTSGRSLNRYRDEQFKQSLYSLSKMALSSLSVTFANIYVHIFNVKHNAFFLYFFLALSIIPPLFIFTPFLENIQATTIHSRACCRSSSMLVAISLNPILNNAIQLCFNMLHKFSYVVKSRFFFSDLLLYITSVFSVLIRSALLQFFRLTDTKISSSLSTKFVTKKWRTVCVKYTVCMGLKGI